MGKATKWLRAVLGLKKPDNNTPPLPSHDHSTSRSKEKRRWSFVKSYREKDHNCSQHNQRGGAVSYGSTTRDQSGPIPGGAGVPQQSTSTSLGLTEEAYEEEDPNKHAIAVAAATAAVAEAAVAAAQAAAEVVRLTSSGRSSNNLPAAYVSGSSNSVAWRDQLDLDSAAVKIQSAFRGYLARRALRALKALVRLQALVRGHIERKRTAEWLHRMQALLRAQARARSVRVQISESSHSSTKSSHFHQAGPPTPGKFEQSIRTRSGKYEQSPKLKRTGSKSNGRALGDNDIGHLSFNRSERLWDHRIYSTRTGPIDDEKIDKILEIDPGKPHFTPKRRNLFHSSHLAVGSDQYSHSFTTSKDSTTHQTVQSLSSGEVQSLSPLKFVQEPEDTFCTAANSPQLYSASSKGGSGKISPFTPTKSDGSRSFLSGYSDYPNYMSNTESSRAKLRSLSAPKQRPQYERSSSTKRYSVLGFGETRSSSVQRASALRASFTSKGYPGSGRLDRLGMPIGQRY